VEHPNKSKINQQNNEAGNRGENFSRMPPQNSSRNLKISVSVLIVLLVIGIGVASFYIFGNKTVPKNEQPNPTNNQSVSPTTDLPSLSPNNKFENEDILKQKIIDKARQVKRKKPVIDYSLTTPDYDYDYDFEDYEYYFEEPINIEIKYGGKTIGSFKGYDGGRYIPVYAKNNDLFIVSYCGSIGGICRGDFIKYNILTGKITTIIDKTLDFFMSNDGKKLIIFTVADDWLTFNVWLYNFETEQIIDQSITLKCSILSNVSKNCMDLFLENDQEIIYVPLYYDDIKVGDAYRLTMTENLKATKFSIQSDMLQYDLMYRVEEE
jgi:hypothetical protein